MPPYPRYQILPEYMKIAAPDKRRNFFGRIHTCLNLKGKPGTGGIPGLPAQLGQFDRGPHFDFVEDLG